MHSLIPALVVALVAAVLAPRWGLPRWRAAVICGLAVGSHALLDAMTTTSRGVPLFWPISFHRFEIPWRPIPSAPCGLAYASSLGLKVARIELVQFFPFLLLALRPAGRPAQPSFQVPVEATEQASNYAGRASRSSAPVTRQAT
jgi:inner membrane protein